MNWSNCTLLAAWQKVAQTKAAAKANTARITADAKKALNAASALGAQKAAKAEQAALAKKLVDDGHKLNLSLVQKKLAEERARANEKKLAECGTEKPCQNSLHRSGLVHIKGLVLLDVLFARTQLDMKRRPS